MIYLRELKESDLEAINTWRNDHDIVDLLGANFRYINLETDKEWFQGYMRNRNNQVRCSICLRESHEVVGLISLTSIDYLNSNAELHIMIGKKDCQNKGVGTLAVREMIKHGFLNLNLERIYLSVLVSNERAINMYKKVGFKQEGVLRKAVYKGGQYKDLIQMSLLKEEFNI